jgi:ABC-type nitrate/sulfonate/bicarbonate transport system ATPase subunit
MNDKILRLQGICHSFDGIDVLHEISVEIDPGEFVVIVGPSGCGKTTLLNLISGFHRPLAGSITRPGQTRMVYQNDGLLPWMTVAENIEMGLPRTRNRASRGRRLSELLALVRLESFARHYPHQISPGMRQRVELARALAGEAPILLLDEPFSSLDYQTRLLMRRELAHLLARRASTVVLVTHDIEEAAQLADRIIVLSGHPASKTFELSLDAARPREPTDETVVEAMRRLLDHLGLLNSGLIERSEPDRGAGAAASALTISAFDPDML